VRSPATCPPRARRRLLGVLAVSATLFAVSTAVAATGPPAAWELALFRWANQLPGWVYVLVWPFMQYGVFLTIPVATALAWWRRRRRFAVLLALSGVGIYLAARVVKLLVERGRPGAFVEVLNRREEFAPGSLGYTSGHAAVAATIATLSVMHLRRPWRELSVALVLVVGFGRMYVGAHLPLDLVGGAAMGVSAAAGALLVSALVPEPSPSRHRRP